MSSLALQLEDERELLLDEFIPSRLSDLAGSVNKSIETICSSLFGLTTSEWRVMVALDGCPDLSATEVAGRTLLDKVAVSRAVAKLSKSGYVHRKFADIDRRRSILNLSNRGRRLMAEIAPIALDFEDRLLGDLTRAEIAVFTRVLDKLFVKSHWMGDLWSEYANR